MHDEMRPLRTIHLKDVGHWKKKKKKLEKLHPVFKANAIQMFHS